MMQRRALFLINGEHYAGAERVQDLLALHLPTFGWSVDFVCLKRGVFGQMRQAVDRPVAAVWKRSRLDVIRPIRQVTRILRDSSYALVHTHTPGSALVGHFAAQAAGVPMIHHVHGRTDLEQDSAFRNRAGAIVQRLGLRQARRLIAVSDSTADYLRSLGYPEQRIRVVPNGVSVAPSPRHWQSPGYEWVIGTAALFRPIKGLEVLIQALAQLRAAGWPVVLRAVGTFEREAYRQQILALAAEKGVSEHILWTGFTRDTAAELSKMDLFVVPSLYGEGLPMVLLEAMAAGLPVVASATEGMPGVLDQGKAGVLVRPGSWTALAQAIVALMQAPEKTQALARIGQQRQRDHYSDLAMARQVAAVYQELEQGEAAL